MNWIGIHPLAGRGDPAIKPVSQTVISKPNTPSHREGWISARIASYRLRQEILKDLISASQALVASNFIKSRWLRIVRR
jgi:hypothetical protein